MDWKDIIWMDIEKTMYSLYTFTVLKHFYELQTWFKCGNIIFDTFIISDGTSIATFEPEK